jgi:O-acetyl-ADP-ribose deacetylase (regulator of RNase III)
VNIRVVDGDLLEQDVECVVDPWNRNILPWWMLLPQGVAGAIRRKAGIAPFWELTAAGPMALGAAVATGAGRLPYRAIIHVAAIDLLWRSSERAVRDSVQNAVALAVTLGMRSLALPLLGAGVGGLGEERALRVITEALATAHFDGEVRVVRFAARTPRP